MAFQLIRVVLVIAFLGLAAVLATPRGRLPLALRGVYRLMRKDRGESADIPSPGPVPPWKRLVAFLLVLAAVVVSLV